MIICYFFPIFRYNQNFKGDYCTCHRPYPDPEDTTPDEMIQCVMCEDWFHGRHLVDEGEKPPKDENYSEMICLLCCEKFDSILSPYRGLSVEKVDQANESLNASVVVDDAANQSK